MISRGRLKADLWYSLQNITKVVQKPPPKLEDRKYLTIEIHMCHYIYSCEFDIFENKTYFYIPSKNAKLHLTEILNNCRLLLNAVNFLTETFIGEVCSLANTSQFKESHLLHQNFHTLALRILYEGVGLNTYADEKSSSNKFNPDSSICSEL